MTYQDLYCISAHLRQIARTDCSIDFPLSIHISQIISRERDCNMNAQESGGGNIVAKDEGG